MIVSLPLVRYILKAAVRDRFLLSLFLLAALGTSISIFIGSSAVIESGKFALVFTAAGLHFSGALGLLLFAVFYIRRAFDTRDVDYMLARPMSRHAFLLSHALAFSFLALITACFVILAVAIVAPYQDLAGLALWGFSLAAEYIIVINAALFFSMVISTAVGGAMATAGLYVLARLMGEILGILGVGTYESVYKGMAGLMYGISLVIPRLDLMAQTTWLLYGPGDGVGALFILGQCAVFTALLITAALVDLVRRQF